MGLGDFGLLAPFWVFFWGIEGVWFTEFVFGCRLPL